MPTKRETTGWLFALSDNADSDWGSIDRFYESFMADASSEVFVVESEVWGKTLRKGMRLAAGDGIAFYHTRRAGFPPRDPFGRRPRISLIGTIIDVEQEGQNVTFLSVEVRADDLRALQVRPLVRTEQTERLFRRSGMIPGAVATFYRIPADVWSKIIAASRADPQPVRGHVPEVGFSTLAPPTSSIDDRSPCHTRYASRARAKEALRLPLPAVWHTRADTSRRLLRRGAPRSAVGLTTQRSGHGG